MFVTRSGKKSVIEYFRGWIVSGKFHQHNANVVKQTCLYIVVGDPVGQ